MRINNGKEAAHIYIIWNKDVREFSAHVRVHKSAIPNSVRKHGTLIKIFYYLSIFKHLLSFLLKMYQGHFHELLHST